MPRLRMLAPVVVLLFPTIVSAAPPRHTFKEGRHGPASLRYIHDIAVLTVSGTPEEMGEQIGALTGPQLSQIARYPKRLLHLLRSDAKWDHLLATSKKLLPQFPTDYRKEMDAIAKSAHIDPELLLVGSTFPDILKAGGCSTLIVQPNRSATREPIFGRNLDYPSMGFLQYFTLVTIYHPKGKHSFASVGFPGMLGCVSGMNDAGLALATLEVYWSKDGAPRLDTHGVPYTLCFRRILEECTTARQAERLLRSMKRTTMNNLAVCDRHGGEVLEFTAKNVAVRGPVDDLCCCTNHFRTAELAPTDPRLARLKKCWRYAILEKAAALPRVSLADVAKKLDQVNQGTHTLQTMIFEPASLKLHLAAGQLPSSAMPMQTVELAEFLKPSRGH
jgi:isopenicillin-N N-acyltransferase like protein